MRLTSIYFKLTLKQSFKNYLLGMMSIILTIIVLTICNNLFENMKNGNMDLMPSYLYLRFKYSGIQTIIIIIGGIYVLNQYYRIMKTNLKDYSIIKGLGASRNQICLLIFFQVFLLFTITVPFGIFAGISASQYLLVILSDFVFRNLSYHFIDTSIEISFITGMISCALLAFGVILEEGIRRKLPAQIDSE